MLLDFGATPFRSLENDGNAHFQNSVFNFKEDKMISKGKSWRYSQSRFNMNSRGWATIICYKKLTTRNQAFFGGGLVPEPASPDENSDETGPKSNIQEPKSGKSRKNMNPVT